MTGHQQFNTPSNQTFLLALDVWNEKCDLGFINVRLCKTKITNHKTAACYTFFNPLKKYVKYHVLILSFVIITIYCNLLPIPTVNKFNFMCIITIILIV